MNATLTTLYAGLSEKFDQETAEILSSYIEMKVEKTVSNSIAHLATKDDVFDVRTEIGNVKSDLVKWIVSLFITTTLLIIGLYLKN